jgi:hypothetical protein
MGATRKSRPNARAVFSFIRNGSFKVDFKPFTAFYGSARPNTQRKDFRAL